MASAGASLATTFPLRFVFLVLGSVAVMLAAEYRPRALLRVSTAAWVSLGVAGTGAYLLSALRRRHPGRSLCSSAQAPSSPGWCLSRQRLPQPPRGHRVHGRTDRPGGARPSRRRRPGGRPARGAGLDRAGHGVGRRHLPRQLRARLDRLPSGASTRRRTVGGRGALLQLPRALPLGQRRARGRAPPRRRHSCAACVTARCGHSPGRPPRRAAPSSLFVGWAGPMFLLGSTFFVAYGRGRLRTC